MAAKDREYDLILFGATGYTGRLVARHLAGRQAGGARFRWALAGRSPKRLAAVRDEIGAPEVPIMVADTGDPPSLLAMAESAAAVITTVGPYQLYGSGLVAACTASGADYLDLCGEPGWMRAMIEEHSAQAQQTGARVLFSCGFDSLPSELGVWLCQEAARQRFGGPVPRVRGRVRAFVGGPSGGTVATMIASARAAAHNPQLAALLADPFALTPGFTGPPQPPASASEDDPDLGLVAPFMLGAANRMAVHRSNLLMGHAYGRDFVYDEMILAAAAPPAPANGAAPPPPAPGDGPTAEQREAGSFDMLFIGRGPGSQDVRVAVSSDRDPGYGCTSQMIAETALCLLRSPDVPGGVWTPAAALQARLRDQLRRHTNLTFSVEA
jgi:short subunit dehydrogenase-like uncharacterized protein